MRQLFTVEGKLHGPGKVLFKWQPEGNLIATAGSNGENSCVFGHFRVAHPAYAVYGVPWFAFFRRSSALCALSLLFFTA